MSVPTAFPIGQFLYEIQDTALICVPKGASTASFQRVSFTGSEKPPESPKAEVHDLVDLGPFDDILDVQPVTNRSGQQSVAVLTKTTAPLIAKLSLIAMEEGAAAHLTQMNTGVQLPARVIAGQPKGSLFLLETDPQARLVVSGVSPERGRWECLRLPGEASGTPVAAQLVRRGEQTVLMIATINDGSLKVHAMDWKNVSQQPDDVPRTLGVPSVDVSASDVETLIVGTVSADPGASVAATVTRMRPRSPDQQLAIAWSDSSSKGNIALIGWEQAAPTAGPHFGAKVLAKDAPEVSFAPPEKSAYRLAAADLMHKGADQLVLGYPATCGLYPGCAALLLYTLDESDIANRQLNCESKYAVSNADRQPLASIDLYIGAGVFGTCIGVQVIGGGASTRDLMKGRALVLCGFVPVDQNGFPPMTGGVPGVLSICVGPAGRGNGLAALDPNASQFIAFPSDLRGQSVVLASPHFEQKTACLQFLAIVQAHPYEERVVHNSPGVSLSLSSGKTEGLSLSNETSVTLSDDTSVNLGFGSLGGAISRHVSRLASQSKTDDTNVVTSVTLSAAFTGNDWVLVSEMTYNIWRYPVLRGSTKTPGELLVVMPVRPTEANTATWRAAHDYAYRPRSEVGMLLSYVNAKKDGYDLEQPHLLFDLTGYDVPSGQDSVSITYDLSKTATSSASNHINILNSVSWHGSLAASSELFNFTQVSLGINLGTSQNYSENKVDTSHLNIHQGLNLTVHSGSVKEEDYEYTVTPVIYHHNKLGCLMLAWDVSLGEGWKSAPASFAGAQPCLIRVRTKTENPTLRQLSRSISFIEQSDGAIDIEVEIFNNGLSTARNVVCEFFDVTTDFRDAAPGLPEDIRQLAQSERSLGRRPSTDDPSYPLNIGPLGRPKVKLSGQRLTKPAHVLVRLSMGDRPIGLGDYWGVYS